VIQLIFLIHLDGGIWYAHNLTWENAKETTHSMPLAGVTMELNELQSLLLTGSQIQSFQSAFCKYTIAFSMRQKIYQYGSLQTTL
jgi:hypothetical protein